MEDTAIDIPQLKKSTGRLSSNTLKLIAIAAMLIDHIAWAFVPTLSPLGQVMHIIGRTTAPIMCYFIAEGYYHTRSVKKYALRLFVFAVISYLPFVLFETHGLPTVQTFLTLNVIYTLFLGLLALWAWDKMENAVLRVLVVIGLCILAMPGDWMYYDVLWVLLFGIYHGDFKKQMCSFTVIALIMAATSSLPYLMMNLAVQNPATAPAVYASLKQLGITSVPPVYSQFFQLGVFLALPLLSLYNGKRGGGKYDKWIFYIFYPTHLLIIALLRIYVIK
nr:TraX family protein [uncultured Caproiciproducens sp.]